MTDFGSEYGDADGGDLAGAWKWATDEIERLRLACDALAQIVRDEYPESFTFEEIALTWFPQITEEQRAALRTLDAVKT